MALTGDYDLVCCGHDHCISIEEVENIKGGKTLVLNPGTVGGIGKPPTYIFGDLQTMQFEECAVSTEHTVIENSTSITQQQ